MRGSIPANYREWPPPPTGQLVLSRNYPTKADAPVERKIRAKVTGGKENGDGTGTEIIHGHPFLDGFAVCSDGVFTTGYHVQRRVIRRIVVTVRPSFWSPHTRLCMEPIITSLLLSPLPLLLPHLSYSLSPIVPSPKSVLASPVLSLFTRLSFSSGTCN